MTTRWRILASALPLTFLVACLAAPADSESATPRPTASKSASAPASHEAAPKAAVPNQTVKSVLAISIDGLNPDAIGALGPTGAPNLHRLMAEGAFTLNARTEYELTRTLPNHTGMLTGRPVAVEAGGHGVTFNEDNGSTVHVSAGARVKSVYNLVHKRLGRTGLFATKSKFDFLKRSWKKPIDKYKMIESNPKLTKKVLKDLNKKRRFRLVHLSGPDEAGHADGFMSAPYLAAVQKADKRVGKIMRKIGQTPRLRRNVVLIVTADHGGLGASHADYKALANYRIPFFVWGKNILPADLYAINPTYADPASSRPGYDGIQPIRNGDVANLVTDLLGLPAVPGSVFNKSQNLTVYSD